MAHTTPTPVTTPSTTGEKLLLPHERDESTTNVAEAPGPGGQPPPKGRA